MTDPVWNKDGWGVFVLGDDRFVVRQWPMPVFGSFDEAKAEAERFGALESNATMTLIEVEP